MPFRDTLIPLASSKTLGQVTLLALGMGVYSLLPIVKEYTSYKDYGDIPSDLHAALSLVLGCLLVFRTNAAYGRWWEARTLWGSLINTCRNLSVKLTTCIRVSQADVAFLLSRIASFPKLLMVHLRTPVASVSANSASSTHAPLRVANEIYEWIGQSKATKRIDGDEMRMIDMELAKLLEICGACERIARTPFVRSYRVFCRQCIVLFLFSFPWGVAQDFGWWTVPLTIIVAYFMIGMEIVAEHVEEPFGLDEDDLDLEGMCATIERSVSEVIAKFESRTK
jgi:ion channel-forming bestrophin family protein